MLAVNAMALNKVRYYNKITSSAPCEKQYMKYNWNLGASLAISLGKASPGFTGTLTIDVPDVFRGCKGGCSKAHHVVFPLLGDTVVWESDYECEAHWGVETCTNPCS